MIDGESVRQAAKDLIERHGDGAIEAAREHIEALTKEGDLLALDGALRVLSILEEMVGVPPNPG